MEGGDDSKPCDAPGERRRHVRVAARLPVDFAIAGDGRSPFGSAVTRDISHGGACLAVSGCTAELLERLDELPLLDVVIAGVAATSLRGRVEWVHHPGAPGAPALVGIEFRDVSAADEVAIIDLIAHILIELQVGQPPVPPLLPRDTPPHPVE